MARGPEAKIEDRSRKAARARGWKFYKITSPGMNGMPDRLMIRRGWHVWIEFKAPGKKPTKQQLHRHAELRTAGAEVHVIDSYNTMLGLLDDLDDFE